MKKYLWHLCAATLLCSVGNAAVSPEVEKSVESDKTHLLTTFKQIHKNPELGFMETETSKIVADELKKFGYEVVTGIGKTGVAGVLKNGKGPVVMYRADMDANAVKETTGLPYASTKVVKRGDGESVPVMHACGHDAHTTWLLGIAKTMKETRINGKEP